MTIQNTGNRGALAHAQLTEAFLRKATGNELTSRILQIAVENQLTATGLNELATSTFAVWAGARGGRMAEVNDALAKVLRTLGNDKTATTPGSLFHELMSNAPRPDGGCVGVQRREACFGEGLAWRVYEKAYKGAHFGIVMGDLTQAPAKAIVLPGSGFTVESGGAENAIYQAGGRGAFSAALANAGKKYGKPLGSLEAVALGSTGTLPEFGIQTVIATNIWPKGGGPTVDSVAQLVANACAAAHAAGADSVAVPAIGVGFSEALSPEQSLEAAARGFKLYLDSTPNPVVRRFDIAYYMLPTGNTLATIDRLTGSLPSVFG